jgi:superfamily I DNA and/or RNA helicase
MVDLQIPKVVLLDTQYRMHPSLYTFSNDNYYKGKIRSEQGMDLKKSLVPDFIKNLIFIDTSGTDWSESWDENLESFSNPEEAEFLIQFINSRKDILQNHDFSAITPYRAQKINIETNSRGNIPIHTIDSFQGRETDILFCSLVRSNTDREIGFLEDDKRLNVLLTRARNQLILIGDGSTLSTSKKFQKLLKTIEIEGEIHSAFEFME